MALVATMGGMLLVSSLLLSKVWDRYFTEKNKKEKKREKEREENRSFAATSMAVRVFN